MKMFTDFVKGFVEAIHGKGFALTMPPAYHA